MTDIARRFRLVPELVCRNIDESLRFYTEVLGFEILFARPEERFAFLDREGAAIMLEQPTGRSFVSAPLEPPYGRGMNLQIEVSDIQGLHTTAQAAGADIYLPIEEKWYRAGDVMVGNHQFIVADPDGYLLRFFEDLGERPT